MRIGFTKALPEPEEKEAATTRGAEVETEGSRGLGLEPRPVCCAVKDMGDSLFYGHG
jgi:hypothetical protein